MCGLLGLCISVHGQAPLDLSLHAESNYSGLHTNLRAATQWNHVQLALGLSQNWSQSFADRPIMGVIGDVSVLTGSTDSWKHGLGLDTRHEWPLSTLSIHQIVLSSSHHWQSGSPWGAMVRVGYGIVVERTAANLANRTKRAGVINLGCVYSLDI